MNNPYNSVFKVGDRLIIELKSKDIFEGIYADGGKDRIVLTEASQHNTRNKLNGFYEFYRSEVEKIHKLKTPPTNGADALPKAAESDPAKVLKDFKTIKVSEDEYFRLKEMSRNYVYIDNPDKRYFEAVTLLKECETIGVACLGMEKRRSLSFVRLLAISTWRRVYIFDLGHLERRHLYPEIVSILESERVCKVVHKSASLVDMLYRDYNVYMQNTFDTEIVDLMLQKKATGKCPAVERNLAECLTHYLNFPSSILSSALNVSRKTWNERPLSDDTKRYAAQLVTYLVLLKEHLQKLLLKDVYDKIATVQDRVYDMDDFDFLNYNSKPEVPKTIQDIITN